MRVQLSVIGVSERRDLGRITFWAHDENGTIYSWTYDTIADVCGKVWEPSVYFKDDPMPPLSFDLPDPSPKSEREGET